MTPDEELKELREESVFMKRLVGYQDQKIEALIAQVTSLQSQTESMKALLIQSATKMKELEAQKDDRPVNPLVQMTRRG